MENTLEQDEGCQPKDLSMKYNKRLKPIPPPLNLTENSSTLKEFAILATSPKSPLMQKNLPFRKRAHSLSGTYEYKPQLTIPQQNACNIQLPGCSTSLIKANNKGKILPHTMLSSPSCEIVETISNCDTKETCPTVTVCDSDTHFVLPESPVVSRSFHSSTYSPCWSPTPTSLHTPSISSVLMSPLGSSREELYGSVNIQPWPIPAWHCFQPGSLIKVDMFNAGTSAVFKLAEEMSPADWIGALRFEYIEEDHCSSHLTFHFSSLGTGYIVTAQCHSLHTFFVKEKGWCAVYPEQITLRYQVFCRVLERGDICCSPQNVLSPDICDRFKRFSFPPEEVIMPVPLLSPPSSPCKKPVDPDRPKRPMNAFMLFAKRYRLELIQMHPGKDNRAISVILGEAWRRLPPADKEEYVLEARAMAQEQKRLHPDCWKRKRSHSTS